jgi:hypothetical protein
MAGGGSGRYDSMTAHDGIPLIRAFNNLFRQHLVLRMMSCLVIAKNVYEIVRRMKIIVETKYEVRQPAGCSD